MTTNLERFKMIVEQGFSCGDLTVADEVCADGLIEHQYLARIDLPGPQILKPQIEDARRGIERLTLTVEAAVEVGDTVWARGKVTGADPRSGKSVAIDVIDVCRFADGKLVEHWGVPDRFAKRRRADAPRRRRLPVPLNLEGSVWSRGVQRRVRLPRCATTLKPD
jgi:ketosteroid isomerase-like protein